MDANQDGKRTKAGQVSYKIENLPAYWREKEVGAHANVSVSWLRKMRAEDRGIPYIKLEDHSIRYKIQDVLDYLENARAGFTGQEVSRRKNP